MPKEKFTESFVNFTFESFPELDVRFIVYGLDSTQGYRSISDPRVLSVESARGVFRSNACRLLLNDSDLIILNWVYLSILPSMAPYLHKTLLMFWGGDFSPYLNKDELGLAMRLKRVVLSRSIDAALGVIALVPSELPRIDNLSTRTKRSFVGEMAGPLSSYVYSLRPVDNSGDGVVRVLLGNSATPSNRHSGALELLARYRDCPLEVYAPLSYGDERYRDEVVRFGREKLGEKFKPLLDFMGRDAYLSFLSEIDVGFFNFDRQQGLGNIYALLSAGKKVYLSSDCGVLTDVRAIGGFVFETESVATSDFSDFCSQDATASNRNIQLFGAASQYSRAIEHWSFIYDFCQSWEGDE